MSRIGLLEHIGSGVQRLNESRGSLPICYSSITFHPPPPISSGASCAEDAKQTGTACSLAN